MLEASRKTRALRELRSLCAEVAQNDPEAFAELVAIHDKFGEYVRATAHELRTEGGYSWAALSGPLGLTRSGVQQRYALRISDGARITPAEPARLAEPPALAQS